MRDGHFGRSLRPSFRLCCCSHVGAVDIVLLVYIQAATIAHVPLVPVHQDGISVFTDLGLVYEQQLVEFIVEILIDVLVQFLIRHEILESYNCGVKLQSCPQEKGLDSLIGRRRHELLGWLML